jgi:hypothetical protein
MVVRVREITDEEGNSYVAFAWANRVTAVG